MADIRGQQVRQQLTEQQQLRKQQLLIENFVENSIDGSGRPLDILLPIYLQHIKNKRVAQKKVFNAFTLKRVEDLPFIVQLLNKNAGEKDTCAEFFVRNRTGGLQHVALVHYQKVDGKYSFAIMEPVYKVQVADGSYPSAILTNNIIKSIKSGFSEADYNQKVQIYVLTNHIQKSQKGCIEIAFLIAEEAANNTKKFFEMISDNPRLFYNEQLQCHKDNEKTAIKDKNVFSINPGSLTAPIFTEIKKDNPAKISDNQAIYLTNERVQSERKK
jgi:hypothetical protein